MKKNKLLKTTTALCMVIAMLFSLNFGIKAVGSVKDQTQDVTITNLEDGVSISVYKLIDLNISDEGSIMTPMYSWTGNAGSGMAKWVNDNASSYINLKNSNEVTATYIGLPDGDHTGTDNDKAITQFYQKVASAIRGGSISSLSAAGTATATGKQVTFQDLEMGQYIAIAAHKNDAKKIYYPLAINVLPNKNLELNGTQSIAMKNKPVTIEKSADDTTVEVGQTVNYTLEADIPVYPTNVNTIHYVIGDKLSTGLTLQKDSIKVYGGSNSSTLLVEDRDYTLDTVATGDATFKVTMKESYLKTHSGEKLKVKYSAKVNKNAVIGNDNLKNDAYLEFNNDPFNNNGFTKIPVEEQVYTYTIEFTKVDNDGNTPLNGAKFTLSKDGKKLNFDLNSDGNYTLSENQQGTGTDLTSSNNGVFVLKGLEAGTYVLKETKSPSGYILPNGEATITLVDGPDADGNLDEGTSVSGYEVEITSKSGIKFSFKVKNKQAGDFDLPVTGGAGTLMFTVGGLILMAGAVLLFVSNKKKMNMK